MYRWDADEETLPCRCGWAAGPLADDSTDDEVAEDADAAEKEQFQVATDFYYIKVLWIP